MYERKLREQELEWTALDFAGVFIKVLVKNQQTGAMTVLTRIDAGAVIPAHSHSKADETVFVLEGDFIEDGESYSIGSCFFGGSGTTHGPHSTSEGCLLLTQFSAELDFILAE